MKDFTGIPTKTRHIQMTSQLLEYCKTEIQYLLDKKKKKTLTRKFKSPCELVSFYVQKHSKNEEVSC